MYKIFYCKPKVLHDEVGFKMSNRWNRTIWMDNKVIHKKLPRRLKALFHVMRFYVSNRHLAASVMPQANIIILSLAWSVLHTVLTCHYMILYVDLLLQWSILSMSCCSIFNGLFHSICINVNILYISGTSRFLYLEQWFKAGKKFQSIPFVCTTTCCRVDTE